jgi:hypothetical protein
LFDKKLRAANDLVALHFLPGAGAFDLGAAGGVAPATVCSSVEDIGHQAFVPYTTDYLFDKQANK